MITKSLDVVLSNPGVWVAMTNVVCLIEVEPSGVCHQLNLRTMEREHLLARGGWGISNGLQFIGPLGFPLQSVRREDASAKKRL